MSYTLLVIESPGKIKKLEEILGKKYKIVASYGHIYDLPIKKMGIDFENNYKPEYEFLEKSLKNIKIIKDMYKNAKEVILASDQDREGEFISYSIAELLKLKKPKRIVFNEITENAIKNALKNVRTLDYNLINAQKTRRIIDRIVGYKIQPYLQFRQSAGRVQSILVKLIIEKENEIKNSKYENYYLVNGLFNKNITAKLSLANKLAHIDKIEIENLIKEMKNANYIVEDIKKSKEIRSPSAPFITSTLQQEAGKIHGFTTKQTMSIAQKLYENGHITYMRTDSVMLSNESLESIEKYIIKNYGKEYSSKFNYINKSKNAQEAHEAIRPTHIENININGTDEEKKLYKLIWNRGVASQMAKAQLDIMKLIITFKNKKYYFESKMSKIVFDGYLKIYRNESEEEEEIIQENVKLGETLKYKKIMAEEKYNRNLTRYNEVSLVKKLEELEIGRPATYANMIEKIQERQYVIKKDIEGETKHILNYILTNKIEKEKKEIKIGQEYNKLVPTEIGNITNDYLEKNFSEIMDYNFTAEMENKLDEISNGKEIWINVIDKFYKKFIKSFKNLSKLSTNKEIKNLGYPLQGKWKEYEVKILLGRYGYYVCLFKNNECEKKAPIKDPEIFKIKDIDKLFEYPKELGKYNDKMVELKKGRFGLYLYYNNKNYGSSEIIDKIDFHEAIKIIKEKDKELIKTITNNKVIYSIKIGKYGPFINYKNKLKNVNVKIPEKYHKLLEKITYDDIKSILENAYVNKKRFRKFTKK